MKRYFPFCLLAFLLMGLVMPATAAMMPVITTNERLPDGMAGVYYYTKWEGQAHGPLEFTLESGSSSSYVFPTGSACKERPDLWHPQYPWGL